MILEVRKPKTSEWEKLTYTALERSTAKKACELRVETMVEP